MITLSADSIDRTHDNSLFAVTLIFLESLSPAWDLNLAQGPIAAVVMQLSLKYVKASLIYLVVGGTLILLTFAHLLPFEMTAFYFMQLYGFVAMMIFGLSYLFVPSFMRFSTV